MEFLASIEHSAFSTWVRTTPSIFGHSGMLFLHTAGLAIVVGLSVMIDLRLLGFAPRLPVAPLERFFPLLWIGFWINAVSGAILFAQDATTKAANPAFGIKMILIALAVAVTVLIRRVAFRRRGVESSAPSFGRTLALASLALWIGATTAGRLMAYVDVVPGVPGLDN